MPLPEGMPWVASPVVHQEVAVARALAEGVDEAIGDLLAARILVDEDGAVLVALGRREVERGHVRDMQVALLRLHLVPLVVASVVGVDLAEGLHGEEEDQFEMRNTPGERLAF